MINTRIVHHCHGDNYSAAYRANQWLHGGENIISGFYSRSILEPIYGWNGKPRHTTCQHYGVPKSDDICVLRTFN